MNIRASIAATVIGLIAGVGCSSGGDSPAVTPQSGAVTETTQAKMTFAECQASAEYPGGGRYAVEFDNGVCKVQRP